MNWMGWWSMWVVVVHKAIFYLVAPYFIAGLGLMIASMPIFYCAWGPKWLHHSESPSREDGTDTPSGTGLKRSSQDQEDFDPNLLSHGESPSNEDDTDKLSGTSSTRSISNQEDISLDLEQDVEPCMSDLG